MTKYKTIVVDPPWKYGTWGKSKPEHRPNDKPRPLPFPFMSVEEIKALPVKNMAADNCELYLWTTQKYLPNAFDVLKAWGFTYCQTLTWCKKPMGTGQGGVFCPTTEFLILGRRGNMPKVKRIPSTWFLTKRESRHSKKPEFFQDLIESVTEGPRLEMFARRARLGWDVYGNEAPGSIKLI